MTVFVDRDELSVAEVLADFIEAKALVDTGVSAGDFWRGFSAIVHDLGPKNRALLARREELQNTIDAWHIEQRGKPHDANAYEAFLREIGYLVPEGETFEIETENVDPELSLVPGPQLVVPVTNARFALNAANARWGSLYDALYGSDALGDLPKGKGYDPERGARVIAWAKQFLDKAIPLSGASWSDVDGITRDSVGLALSAGGETKRLANRDQWVGVNQEMSEIVFSNNGLHVIVQVDKGHPIGQSDPAGIADVVLESAVSTIMDCEDSVACVDAEDKVLAYSNWLGLMRGDLEARLDKGGKEIVRRMNPDRAYLTPAGEALRLKGRSMMLVRNVGPLMTNPAIRDRDGNEVPEEIMDAMITTLIAMHDLQGRGAGNSAHGSVYVVKPKLHGPEEAAHEDTLFSRVEAVLGLPKYTVKLGIMDEERRTSVNLKECIRAAKHRVAFINTGFLDRTGDEIHTSMEAGPMIPKGEMKGTAWIASYEDRNVDIGLACGLKGKAQIGKGMWAMPDRMADMMEQKIGHPMAGATCAWVPSPTAATLHATHYHEVDVMARQDALKDGGARGTLEDLLAIPMAAGRNFSEDEIAREVENNAQGILGYVVRWIDQGVGCSKVPDINDVGLMEDRATCRISAQALTNWLHHDLIDEAQVVDALRRMAVKVDAQNAGDGAYVAMAPGYEGVAFQAACDLVLRGRVQPSGYTEPVLHGRRLEAKAGA